MDTKEFLVKSIFFEKDKSYSNVYLLDKAIELSQLIKNQYNIDVPYGKIYNIIFCYNNDIIASKDEYIKELSTLCNISFDDLLNYRMLNNDLNSNENHVNDNISGTIHQSLFSNRAVNKITSKTTKTNAQKLGNVNSNATSVLSTVSFSNSPIKSKKEEDIEYLEIDDKVIIEDLNENNVKEEKEVIEEKEELQSEELKDKTDELKTSLVEEVEEKEEKLETPVVVQETITKEDKVEVVEEPIYNEIKEETPVEEEKVTNPLTDKVEQLKNTTRKLIDKTINIDIGTFESLSLTYSNMEETLQNSKIVANNYVRKVYNRYSNDIEKDVAEINKMIHDIGAEIIEAMRRVEIIDDSIVYESSDSFDNIKGILSLYRTTGSKIKLADASFFDKCPNATIKGNKVTYSNFTYDLKTNILTNNKKGSNQLKMHVKYYVPTNINNVSSLNTITCLGGESNKSLEMIVNNNTASNSIVIFPTKKAAKGCYTRDMTKNDYDVALSTVFIKGAINQSKSARNTIIGGSSGGASALRIAAADEAYDTVICVNNALLVRDKNAIKGTKEQFTSLDELSGLNGKTVYFISSRSDPNMDMCASGNSGWTQASRLERSYLYTGLELLVNNCPDSQVYMITNRDSSAFSKINAPNYHYSPNYWTECFGSGNNYAAHGTYSKIIGDFLGKV